MRTSFFFSIFFCIGTFLFSQPTLPVVVLGGGVGGLTSALYLARGGYEPIVIEGDMPGGMITQSPQVENWPGEKKISGLELIEKIRDQVVSNGAKILKAEVVKVNFSKEPLEITIKYLDGTQKTETLHTASVVIAAGSSPRFLGVKGEKEFWGKGVSHCALCDGNLYRGKSVAVVGGKESAITEALYLSGIAKKVYLIYRKDSLVTHEEKALERLKAAANIVLVPHTKVLAVEGKDAVTGVRLQDTKTAEEKSISLEGVFLAIGSDPNTKPFKGHLELAEDATIALKGLLQHTSHRSVFSAGDISSPYKQAIIAAGNGATAAIQAMEYLEKQGILPKAKASADKEASMASFEIREIQSTSDLEKEMAETKIPLLMDFYATWCGPCKRLAPLLEQYGKALSGKVKILKVNVDQHSALTKEFQIRGLPTMVVYGPQKGVLQKRVGTDSIAELLANLINRNDLTHEERCAYLESSIEGKSLSNPSSK